MKTPTTIGARIKDARLERGMTLEGVAEKLEESPSTVRGWERGHYEPRAEKMQKILKWLASAKNGARR